MVVGGAPPLALVIEQAARVEAQIAADRSHVAMGGPGDEARGLRHHRIVSRHLRMRGKLGELDRGADLERARVGLDRAQLLHVIDVDEHRRGDDPAADRKSTRLNSSHLGISYAVFCLKKKKKNKLKLHTTRQ